MPRRQVASRPDWARPTADGCGDGTPAPEHGWVDTFRALKPEAVEYSWWSQRGAARANDVGWRIDYQFATPSLRAKLKGCAIHPTPRFSDHAPYVVDYDVKGNGG